MWVARIVGSGIAHVVPLKLLAGVGHCVTGSVHWPMLAALRAGSVPAISVGSYARVHVPERLLRAAPTVTLIAVAVRPML